MAKSKARTATSLQFFPTQLTAIQDEPTWANFLHSQLILAPDSSVGLSNSSLAVAHSQNNTPSLCVRRQLFQLLKLLHRDVVAQMSLQELVGDKSFRSVTLGIDERDVVVDVTDTLQFVGMSMMVRTSIDADQKDGNVSPRQTEKIEFEFVHVSGFAVEEQE